MRFAILILAIFAQTVTAQTGRPVFTNEDFPAPTTPSVTTTTPQPDNRQLARAPELQMQLLDLKLAALEHSDNDLLTRISILERRIAETEPSAISPQHALDLQVRTRYVALRTELAEAEKNVVIASEQVQRERRRVVNGGEMTKDGFTTGLQYVQKATEELRKAEERVARLKDELQRFQEESRRLGASPRALR